MIVGLLVLLTSQDGWPRACLVTPNDGQHTLFADLQQCTLKRRSRCLQISSTFLVTSRVQLYLITYQTLICILVDRQIDRSDVLT